MASLLKSNNMARNKLPPKKDIKVNTTMQVLNQLAMQSNITIKKNLVLRTYSKTPEIYNAEKQKIMKLKDLKEARFTANQIINRLTGKHRNVTETKGILIKHCSTNIQNNIVNKSKHNRKVTKMTLNKKIVELADVQKAKKVQKKLEQAKKSLLIENKEFYPEKPKRNVIMNKVVLKPKHDYKVVATTNKRKRRIPHREVDIASSSPIQSTETPSSPQISQSSGTEELSLSQLMMMAEEQGLDDEDLMEILTCPSPVWWEEHSDDEDEINISFKEDLVGDSSKNYQTTLINEIYSKTTSDANANRISAGKTELPLKKDVDIFKKFVAKRSKLEKVLGNIKCKKVTADSDVNGEKDVCKADVVESPHKKSNDDNAEAGNVSDKDCVNNCLNNEIINTLDCAKAKSCNDNDLITDEIKNVSLQSISDNIINDDLMNSSDSITEESSFDNEIDINNKKERKDSSGGYSDISINDELINSLECVEIPVQQNDNKVKVTDVTKDNKSKIYETVNENRYESIKRVRKPNKKYEFCVIDEKKRRNRKKKDEIKLTKINLEDVPPELPPLTKKPIRNHKTYDSPKSIGSMNSESNASVELDSISDSNVKFLDEYIDNKKEPVEAVNVNKYGQTQTGELVTVYQIVSNKNSIMDDDIESQIKVNLVNKSPQIVTDTSSKSDIDHIDVFCHTKGRRKYIRNK